MTPADLSLTVQRAVRRAVEQGVLAVEVPELVRVERPRPGGRGDYASNVALVLARSARRAPLDVAALLREELAAQPCFERVDVTGPGFLNFTLRDQSQTELVRRIRAQGLEYGHRPPTGDPVQLVHRADLRAAVVADALRRIHRSQGHHPVRVSCEGPVEADWALLGAAPAPAPADARGPHGAAPAPTPDAPTPDAPTPDAPTPDAPAPGATATHPTPTPLAPLPVPHDAPALLRRFGVDAARWALVAVAGHDQAKLTDELLHQHEGNPLFRVRYAYSRSRALLRNADQLGFRSEPQQAVDAPVLTGLLRDHPAVLASAARLGAPDRVARHLEATADALLAFQHTVLPLGDEKPSAAHRSRLALAEAAGTVLAGGLSLLGVSAPEQI
ncbi:ArgS-related anticodon-binding protein NrtL [Streptomyces tritici]|uniref:ArgS-related anticodon-binding protein NrtL n=1 Tax=Streptomyces tritici TaxID=2054410 RepID=UPI003AEFA160